MSALPDVSLGDGIEPSDAPVAEDPAETSAADPDQVPETGSLPSADLVPVDPGPDRLPAADLPGPTGPERAAAVVRHVVHQTTESARRRSAGPGPGSAQPESWTQYRARVRARGWVPKEYRETWLGWVPAIHYATVGNVGWALGNGIVWLTTHMLAFYVAFLLTGSALILWFCFN